MKKHTPDAVATALGLAANGPLGAVEVPVEIVLRHADGTVTVVTVPAGTTMSLFAGRPYFPAMDGKPRQ